MYTHIDTRAHAQTHTDSLYPQGRLPQTETVLAKPGNMVSLEIRNQTLTHGK